MLSKHSIQARIEAAKQMLREGEAVDVTDTAGLSGYKNISLFYSHFRRETGMTPVRFKQLFANNISRSIIDTPIGALRIIASHNAILCVERVGFINSGVNVDFGRTTVDQILSGDASGELVRDCEAQLEDYFAGRRRNFDLPLDPEGTDFQKNVWKHLREIPYGETKTYGELAEMMGNKKASRAVGMANHYNPILIIVPCHRIIGSDGSLTGYAAGLEVKKTLLAMEKEV